MHCNYSDDKRGNKKISLKGVAGPKQTFQQPKNNWAFIFPGLEEESTFSLSRGQRKQTNLE